MIKLILVLVGAYLIAFGFLPAVARLPLIGDYPATWRLGAGAAALVVGLLFFLRRRPTGGEISDRAIKDELIRRGFHFIAVDRGWRAEGPWNQVPVAVARASDYHATRFGRPWVIVVTMPGNPVEPWPFLPDQAMMSEKTGKDFTVVIVDASYAGQQGRFAERMNGVVKARK